ncbi:MAG: dephospho-CoA kinase [Oscillospiraceae bacterium]|nr:dephospho-CoA kinase [Bacillota bacterium]
MILGITGGSGCGKTTALEAVRDLGGLVLDCDAIYHDLLSRSPSLLAAIDRRFPGVVSQSGLDRKKLGRLVFSDAEALQDLNRIAHGAVKAEVLARLTAHPPPLAAIDAIALFEGGLAELCQYTVAVTAPWEDRITRLMSREGISRDYAEARLRAQHDGSYFQRLCDFTLENNGAKDAFYQTARTLILQLLGSAPDCEGAFDHTNPKPTIFKEDHHE